MSIAKITLTGQETYLSRTNKSLFDFMSLPAGIDKDNLIDNILMECGEFEVLYSDPEFNRSAIGTWSTKHYRTFEKWITALNIEYNPLENYDRFEDYKDTGTENSNTKNIGTSTEKTTGSTNNTGSYSENEDVTENIDNDVDSTVENTVSAFDSDSYQPADKSDTETKNNTDRDMERDLSGSTKNDTSTTSNTTGNTTGNEDFTKGTELLHVGRLHGNIGVTTSQQMLQSELDIARFNIINEITKIFMQELCICIYE